MGTVKGDVHDIGKNLVNIMLEGAGFHVIDLGVQVPPEKFVAAIEEHKDEIIALAKDILMNPETGYMEMRTSGLVKEWFKRLDIPYRDEIALTGVKGQLQGRAGAGPAVGLVAEMDSMRVADHPFADHPLTDLSPNHHRRPDWPWANPSS